MNIGLNEALSAALSVADKIKTSLKPSHVENLELSIKVPEQVAVASMAVEVRRRFSLNRVIRFPIPQISRITIHSLPFLKSQSQAIVSLKDGFELRVKKLDPDVESVALRVEYVIEDKDFLDNLVETNVQHETSTEERNEFWMHAQLKHMPILEPMFGRLDLIDIPISVDVAVHQDIKTRIPHNLVRELQVVQEWLTATDREAKRRLTLEHTRLRRERPGKEVQKLLADVQGLFLSTEFAKFIEVSRPFRYAQSLRSGSLFDVPFQTFPRLMTVVSRTDLSKDNPAAEGTLVYKKRDFQSALTNVFGVEHRRVARVHRRSA